MPLTTRTSVIFPILLMTCLALTLCGASRAQSGYSFSAIALDTYFTSASGINDSGKIVGSYLEQGYGYGSSYYGFIKVNGRSTPLEYPGAQNTQANGISNNDLIVGEYCAAPCTGYNGYVYNDSSGSFTSFSMAGYSSTYGYGINSAGAIVGVAIDSQNNARSFLYSKGQFTLLNFPGAAKTTVNGINDSGQIVGAYLDQSQKEHGFLYFQRVYITVDYPGALDTYLEGINGAGQMTGEWADSSFKDHGFVDVAGDFTSFDKPLGYITIGLAINDSGQIVGQFEDGGAYIVGFLAVPALEIVPGNLTYPTQFVGTSSAPQKVTLTNTGTATLTLYGETLLGVDRGDFTRKRNCGGTLLPGASCDISVTFSPKGINARTAVLSISDSAVGSPQTVPIKGEGTYVELGSNSLNFGSVKVGQQSTPQTITLTNTAPFTLNLSEIAISGKDAQDFAQTNTCSSSISSGQSCIITVVFVPTLHGTRTALLAFFDNGGASPQSVTLTGTGT